MDDYFFFFVCVCVYDSIFPACVGGALICETKTISLYLTTYAKKKAHGKGAGKIRGERVEELCWVSS